MQPVDTLVVGTALDTQGFTAFNTVEGLGLNTFGFLWPCEGIWGPSDGSITTIWVSSINPANIEVCTD